jgi:hypothetical protein
MSSTSISSKSSSKTATKSSSKTAKASKPNSHTRSLRSEARVTRQKGINRIMERAFSQDNATVSRDAAKSETDVKESRPGLLGGLLSWGNSEEKPEVSQKPVPREEFYTAEEIAKQDEAMARVRKNGKCVRPGPPGGTGFSLPPVAPGRSGNSEVAGAVLDANVRMMENHLKANPNWEQEQGQKWVDYSKCTSDVHNAFSSFIKP